MSLIPITGYPSSWRAPFTAAEILLGQGPSNAAAGPRQVCYVAPKTAAGTGTVNTVYQIGSEKEARDLAGVGSPAHRLVRRHLMCNPRGKVSIVLYAASSGGSPATANGNVVVTASPTAAGVLRGTICGEPITVAWTTSSTATTIGDDIAAQVNAKDWLPCTASNSTGTVTFTAKIAGASQGDGTVGVIRFRFEPDPGKGVTVAVSGAALGLGTGTAGADGSTTETTNFTAALDVIANARYYYIGASVWSSTAIVPLKTHIATKSDPSPGLRSIGVTAYTHTLAALSTIAIASNYERRLIAWQKNSEHDTADIVGNVVAILQKREENEPASGCYNFDDYAGTDWQLLPAYAASDWPSEQDVNDAVTDGIIPIKSSLSGSSIGMMVSTRSKNAGGTLDDFRACERHRLSAMDWLVDTILLRWRQQYANFMLKDDQYLPNGAVNPNQKLGPRTLTPSRARPFLAKILTEFDDLLIQGATDWVSTMRVSIDPSNVSRIEAGLSGRSMDLLHQASFRVAETTPG